MEWLRHRITSWLASRCTHPRAFVVADITEGDKPNRIRWCRACGSINRFTYWEWPKDPWRGGPTGGEEKS